MANYCKLSVNYVHSWSWPGAVAAVGDRGSAGSHIGSAVTDRGYRVKGPPTNCEEISRHRDSLKTYIKRDIGKGKQKE